MGEKRLVVEFFVCAVAVTLKDEGCWMCFLSVKILIKGIFIVIILDVYRKFKEIA